MKITSIKQQLKRADRFSIFVDQKYAFSLSERELIASGVHSGLELDNRQLKDYKKRSQLDKVYGLVLNLLSIRARSKKEITDYLWRKGYDEGVSTEMINKLSKSGLINDEAFAQHWLENRRLLKTVSRRRLSMELRQKGIASDIADKVLSDDQTTDIETLTLLIERKRQQTRYQDKTKLMQYLARQGFSYSDIKVALEDNS